ncbi:MAG: glycoside hydrolase family 3 C-terminal domain-containing protein [Bacteroidales bacterium]|jgi:beta-glucosidase
MSGKYLLVLFALLSGIFHSSDLFPQVYLDQKSSVEDRTEDLLKQLSVSQKIQYIGGYNSFYISPVSYPAIPAIKMSDGPVGVRTWGKTTAFPAGICSAATWDTALIHELGRSLGRDARARGVHILLGPGVNIQRAPMCGRNFEYYGEDPYLAGQIAASFVEGVQSEHVMATVKHFAANNQEWDRYAVSSDMDERTLQEIYLPAFKAAVVDAKAGAVMSAYNLVNGSWCSQNMHLLTEILKRDWKFDGFVMSDWGATHDGLKSAMAGLDLEMPSGAFMNLTTLKPAIDDGRLPESVIDDKIRRILRTLIRFGFLDHPQLDASIPLDNPASNLTALNIARSGIVLLKNQGNFLPLDRGTIKRIAVIGPNGNSYVTGGGSSYTDPYRSTGLASALRLLAGPEITVTYDAGQADDETVFGNSLFYTIPGSSSQGLYAEYYSNQSFTGNPFYTGTNATVNFTWGSGGPAIAGFPTDHFSVRWTGVIRPLTTGAYEFIVRCDDGCRLYIDNQLVISQWNDHAAATYRVTVNLTGGTEHSLRLEYYENAGDAEIRMGWRLLEFADEKVLQNAANADAAIVCVGFNSNSESEGFDRTFALPNLQDSLITAVARVNPRTLVVLNAGGNVATAAWISEVEGLLHAWYPGQEGGTALAELIFGLANPSGKLPVSLEKRWEDNPVFNSYYDPDKNLHVPYSEGLLIGYRHYDTRQVEPLFPFGFGLSYTAFEYSNLSVSPDTTDHPNGISISFDIRNTGGRDGEEVAQLYIHQPVSKLIRPYKELKDFSKVFLRAGESKNVTIRLDSTAFSYYKPYIKNWGLDYTTFDLLVGSSSRDIRLTGQVVLQSPDLSPPVVTGLTPSGNTGGPLRVVLFSMEFNKPVYFNPDQRIVIKEYETGTTREIIEPLTVSGSGTRNITFYGRSALPAGIKYFVLVDSAAFIDVYDNSFAGITLKDTWSFKISASGMEDHFLPGDALRLYPNPVRDLLIMDYRLPAGRECWLQVIDIAGRPVITRHFSSEQAGSMELDCHAFRSGFYFVKLYTASGSIVKTFIRE